MSFEKIPRFGPKIGTLGTPGGPMGPDFSLKFFLYKDRWVDKGLFRLNIDFHAKSSKKGY